VHGKWRIGLPLALPAGLVSIQNQPGRSWWLLAVLGLLFGAEIVDLRGTLINAADYEAFAIPFPAAIRLIFSGLWALILGWLFLALFFRRRRAFALTGPILTIYALMGLLWGLLFYQSDFDRGRLTFQAILAALTLIPIWWMARQKLRRSQTESVSNPIANP
jgi:hypothetical protein